MRISDIFAASLVAPLVAAHGDHVPGAPQIFGLNPIGKLKSRNVFSGHAVAAAGPQLGPRKLNARQGGVDGRCGPEAGGASCDQGYCCSSAGWCGQGNDYCQAPDCLFQYGPACDANHLPSGGSTRNIARPQLGSIAYGGEGVYFCTKPGTVAITYDDGPYIYTKDVLDQFAAKGFKATFFITGINIGKGAIDDESTAWPALIKRMVSEGHQVASHTWSHQDLSAITKEQRIDQMVKNEMAFANILGKFPTYMRPPYSSCTAASGCQDDLKELGYVVSYFNLDTDDYNNVTPDLIQNAKDRYFNAINPSNPTSDEFLAIAHDIHQQTALNLTGYMLDLLDKKGYKGVTMGECLGEPESNWYRAGTDRVATSSAVPSSTRTATASASSSAPTSKPTGPTSTDGSCGGTKGYSCIGFANGECCSQYGWCGTSADHCGTGCNPLYGNCGTSGSSSSVPSSTSSSVPSSTPTGKTSTDGTCGGTNGYSCIGFSEGECCSAYGWCGKSTDHCGTGCNPLYGNCGSSVSSNSVLPSTPSASASVSSVISSTVASSVSASVISSSAQPGSSSSSIASQSAPSSAPSSTQQPSSFSTTVLPSSTKLSTPTPTPTSNVSKNGKCGAYNGKQTCKGYGNKQCCRWDGTCGNNIFACGMGCQKKYGTCWW